MKAKYSSKDLTTISILPKLSFKICSSEFIFCLLSMSLVFKALVASAICFTSERLLELKNTVFSVKVF